MNRTWLKKILMSALAVSGSALSASAMTTPIIFAQDAITAIETPGGIASMGSGSASIVITPNADSQSLVGKDFHVYQLFEAENSVNGESIAYAWNPEYQLVLQKVVGGRLNKTPSSVTEDEVIDYFQSLNTSIVPGTDSEQTNESAYSEFRYFVEELRTALNEDGYTGELVHVSEVNDQNSVVLEGLDYGYYLVDEETPASGSYSAASLCMVSTANPEADIKVKSDYPTVTKKINEDDNNIGWNDIADFEIGQTVPYKFTSMAPNMNGYSTYYMAFHDRMDECLTFNPDSVAVTISDDTKTYTLDSSEFSTVVSSTADETFQVQISDIKAIIDREFPPAAGSQENTYGQSIVVSFDATLNDKAADLTGRPGFENSVMLEFSNDPDSNAAPTPDQPNGPTGETPWDTVVCFTYKLNVLKVNEHQTSLADAKFRLYSDANCTQEVYVKQEGNGYIVINRDSTGGTDHTGGEVPDDAVEMVSDDQGTLTIFGLDQGNYWLKETEAPAGYRPLLEPVELTVTPVFTTDRDSYMEGEGAGDKILESLDVTASINGSSKDLVTDAADGSFNLTVENQTGSKLPITGSAGTIIALGSGVVIAGAAAWNLKRKKNSNH